MLNFWRHQIWCSQKVDKGSAIISWPKSNTFASIFQNWGFWHYWNAPSTFYIVKSGAKVHTNTWGLRGFKDNYALLRWNTLSITNWDHLKICKHNNTIHPQRFKVTVLAPSTLTPVCQSHSNGCHNCNSIWHSSCFYITLLIHSTPYEGHSMLAPFTSGWQQTETQPLIIERGEVIISNSKFLLELLKITEFRTWCWMWGIELKFSVVRIFLRLRTFRICFSLHPGRLEEYIHICIYIKLKWGCYCRAFMCGTERGQSTWMH